MNMPTRVKSPLFSSKESLVSEISFYKFSLIFLALAFGFLCIKFAEVSKKAPLIIALPDNANETQVIAPKMTSKRSKKEITQFLKAAIGRRFNQQSDFGDSSFLSQKIIEAKEKDIAFLKSKKISQEILVRNSEISFLKENTGTVKITRIFRFEKTESALPTTLKFKFARTSRNKVNPYGLVLLELKSEEKAKPTPKKQK